MDALKDLMSSSCDDRIGCRTESCPTNGTNPITWQDNYTLDGGEEQEENVMAAGCANLQLCVCVSNAQ